MMRKLSTRKRGARCRVCRAVLVLASIAGFAAFTGAPSSHGDTQLPGVATGGGSDPGADARCAPERVVFVRSLG